MPDASLEEIAAELYSGPPADFVARRNARAKDAGDPDLAAQIRALRKPSVAAWVVNLFARERADRLGQALQLAQELRDAQAELDAATLAQLGRQRRALTNQLAREAVGLASAQGGQVTSSTEEAVRQTIAAAFFDQDAAVAVASGRLVRELESSGSVDLEAAVAGGAPAPPASTPPPTDEVKARRERRAAEAAVHAAEQDVLRAQRDRAKAEDDVADLARRIEDFTRREGELEDALADVRAKLEDARSRIPDTDERTSTAETAVVAAERALDEARNALKRLEAP
jgi:hypothetical protein